MPVYRRNERIDFGINSSVGVWGVGTLQLCRLDDVIERRSVLGLEIKNRREAEVANREFFLFLTLTGFDKEQIEVWALCWWLPNDGASHRDPTCHHLLMKRPLWALRRPAACGEKKRGLQLNHLIQPFPAFPFFPLIRARMKLPQLLCVCVSACVPQQPPHRFRKTSGQIIQK